VDRNFKFFEDNLQDLLSKYANMYIVIKNQCVIAAYSSFDEAYEKTIKLEVLGSFIIQQCTPEALSPTANFAWNNVAFSSVSL